MGKIHDLIIIGSGPAGLSAAVYAQRAELDTIVIEKNMMSGGQILNTYEVDNYPGLPGISGFDLGMKLREHADKLGTTFTQDNLVSADLDHDVKKIVGENGSYEGKTVLIATGAHHKKLGAKGEDTFIGSGVSYCATCDGAFFRGKVTAVIGGGDVAIEDAIFLARMCKQVYLIHRRDELRGAKSLQNKLHSLDNIEVIWDTVVEEIIGENKVKSLKLLNRKTEEHRLLDVDGVFVAVGIEPESREFTGLLAMDKQGYIKAGEEGITSVPGVFVAGDVRTKLLRQIITAASDGANCITGVERYLSEIQ